MVIALENGTRRSTLLTSTVANPVGAIANFSPSITSGCAPFSVNFTDNSTIPSGGPITSWIWNFDNTSIGGAFPSTFTGQNPPAVIFSGNGNETKVVESFDAESQNSIELQRGGWQAILDNFKKYTESN